MENINPLEETSFEYVVEVPGTDISLYVQDGSGSQLLPEDIEEGYDNYIDYVIISGPNAGDGGIYMFKNIEHPDWALWTDAIPETIAFACDVDVPKDINFFEVEEYEEEHGEIDY